ncbi:hypothetical protein EMIT0215P_50089 [Pseudomonas serboccidentalis]
MLHAVFATSLFVQNLAHQKSGVWRTFGLLVFRVLREKSINSFVVNDVMYTARSEEF